MQSEMQACKQCQALSIQVIELLVSLVNRSGQVTPSNRFWISAMLIGMVACLPWFSPANLKLPRTIFLTVLSLQPVTASPQGTERPFCTRERSRPIATRLPAFRPIQGVTRLSRFFCSFGSFCRFGSLSLLDAFLFRGFIFDAFLFGTFVLSILIFGLLLRRTFGL